MLDYIYLKKNLKNQFGDIFNLHDHPDCENDAYKHSHGTGLVPYIRVVCMKANLHPKSLIPIFDTLYI